jgi:hypothetical protein
MNKALLDVYTVCWNEEDRIPLFLAHYGPISNTITVYDNESDDRSVDLLSCHDQVTVYNWDTNGLLDNRAMVDLKNNCWRSSKGWIAVVDMDEFVYHHDLPALLASDDTVAAYKCRGYRMCCCDEIPISHEQLSPRGMRDSYYDKIAVFHRARIDHINYEPGCHTASPTFNGQSVAAKPDIVKLLHYQYLSEDHVRSQYPKLNARRLPNSCWGDQYAHIEPAINRCKSDRRIAPRVK